MKQYKWGRNKAQRENSAAILRSRSEEEYINRDSQILNTLPTHSISGESAYRPSSDYLIRRGVKSMIYFATDTNVLSVWTGTAWKTTTLT